MFQYSRRWTSGSPNSAQAGRCHPGRPWRHRCRKGVQFHFSTPPRAQAPATDHGTLQFGLANPPRPSELGCRLGPRERWLFCPDSIPYERGSPTGCRPPPVHGPRTARTCASAGEHPHLPTSGYKTSGPLHARLPLPLSISSLFMLASCSSRSFYAASHSF